MKRGAAEPPRVPVDWGLVMRRLAALEEALQNEFAPSPEQRQKILHARARALAQVAPVAPAEGAEIEVLEFVLAQEHYAFETCWVREVYSLRELTPLPCTPNFVAGVANVRGRIMSMIDIKRFFDLPERGLGDLNRAIILRDGTMEFGVLADQIIGTSRLMLDALQPSLPTLTGIRADFLKGITLQRLVVLDGGKLLSDRSIVVDQEVSQ